ncbi:serine/threonine-protein kinase [Spirillospora sp. NPDC052242]
MSWDGEGVLAGRYRRLDRIGRGGMGSVWRAHDADLDREVAVKELRVPEQVGEQERAVWYARMEREARAAARLRHPGIVTVYDRVRGDDGRPWIVMELVRGRSLDRVLAEDGALPARRVARIGLAMLDALTAAHAKGVVHRDVKPANVLLEGERVLLTDFGIAAVEGDATLTRTGAVLGTPAYMSPEQVEGRPVTPASDLWSLGATLYAAVEGRPPFAAPTHGALFVAIATRDPEPPSCGGPLSEALTGLLHKDPADRPSPDRIRALLTAATGTIAPPPNAEPGGGPEPTRRMTQPGAASLSGGASDGAGGAGGRTRADAGDADPGPRTDPAPALGGRTSAPAVDGHRYKPLVRAALACTWITVAVTLYFSWSASMFVLHAVPQWLPVAMALALILSIGPWASAHRTAALAAVAAINGGLTWGVLTSEDPTWGDGLVVVTNVVAITWVGGAVALMFAFAAVSPRLVARISSNGSRRGVVGPVVVAEAFVATAWPWAFCKASGTYMLLPTDVKGVVLLLGALACVFAARIVFHLVSAGRRAGDPAPQQP